MTDNVIDLSAARRRHKIKPEHYFGGCPICGATDGYSNLGAEHWFFCDKHQTRWCIGDGLLPERGGGTREEQEADRLLLTSYASVEPVYPRGREWALEVLREAALRGLQPAQFLPSLSAEPPRS